MHTSASPIEQGRGVDGVVKYVHAFGLRRLAAYLLGCAATGFAVATVVMSATSAAWSVTSKILRGVDRDRFGPS